ncbi:putative F-box/LRR-repeat protein At4g15060 isoform X1 [Lycium ferocissimum]|uniref:putative F-box/LRR-repeat protein At4g15060 isoform X1 n=1 Tax=Lycium ferocissimum TaxID=112874 RepID=UPI002815033D|nr:putative F-box/LRR-repeat protein At4g15060 isoform X1 [Lycium ferocissimum]XP_059308219.1 putative F-box/LRR-repeat protein At4g15060 isoform X1 [Lycium ferocissimum]
MEPLRPCIKRQKKHPKCRINNLSDDMLIAILSRLNFHEAARTSILSQRWRYLWKHTSCSLEFYNNKTYTTRRAERFITSVNQVLKLHQAASVEQFKVCFFCPVFSVAEEQHKRDRSIDAWIRFAIGKQVKVFELDLATKPRLVSPTTYSIPHVKKLLSISGGQLKLLTTLRTLKSVRFVGVKITQQVVHYLLSNCPLLEQLCISASNSLKKLVVSGSSPKLRSVEISRCENLMSMEVRAPSLVSLTYIGCFVQELFEEVPSLSELTIGGFYAYYFIMKAPMYSSNCSNLKRLKLEVSSEVSSLCKVIPDEFHQLCHLKKLELDITITFGDGLCFFIFLIKCAPHLSRLTIRLSFLPFFIGGIKRHAVRGYGILNDLFEEDMAKARAADRIAQEAMTFCHKCLKVVKLVGFIGSPSDYELALHLLRIAGSLKRLILCSDYADFDDLNEFWPRSTRKKAIRECADQLKANLSPRAELLTYGPGFSKRI